MLRDDELVVDLFAGGGGASTGLRQALGRGPDLVVDANPAALAMHAANHPGADHRCADIWAVDPHTTHAGKPIGVLWASPPCTSFSSAKGGKDLDRKSRALAWSVVWWAKYRRPRVILLENVPQFVQWSPLDDDGKVVRARRGETFRAWVAKLQSYGYVVEWRTLVAADYGVPTTRKRLYVIARCDGEPITWPEPTHGAGRLPWASAASVLDFALPCPSLFGRARPLRPATLRRVAVGIKRYVLDAASPFVIHLTHPRDARTHGADEPFVTVTAANRGELGYVVPYPQALGHSHAAHHYSHAVDSPTRTITTAKNGETALVVPSLVQVGYNERPATPTTKAQAPRVLDIASPLGTCVASAIRHAVVVSHLQNARTHGSGGGQAPQATTESAPTVTCAKRGGLVLVAAVLCKHNLGCVGQACGAPLGAITRHPSYSVSHVELATHAVSHVSKLFGTNVGSDARDPLPTVTATGNHLAEVRALLCAHAGLPDATATVVLGGTAHAVVDVGLRMLAVHELAGAQGFPADYVLAAPYKGKPLTKTAQVECVGNSCCPPVVAALARANVGSAG